MYEQQLNRYVGVIIHRMLGEFASGAFDVTDFAASATAHIDEFNIKTKHRLAVKTRLVQAAVVYQKRFRPGLEWTPLGHEINVEGGVLDMAFRNDHDGRIFIDELKTGQPRISSATKRQIERFCAAGTAVWGDDFCGVRLCFLTSPRRSQFYNPAGRTVAFVDGTEIRGVSPDGEDGVGSES